MPVEQALGAIEECGAPMVSIAGGEPLIHPEIAHDRRRAGGAQELRLPVHQRPAHASASSTSSSRRPYFAWAVHIDGLRERHDASVEREGVFDKAVAAIRAAKARGLPRHHQHDVLQARTRRKTVREVLDFLNDELEVDDMMISPAYAYEKAPDQDHFLGVDPDPRALPRGVRRGPAQALAAQPHARCSSTSSRARSTSSAPPWGIPCYSVFGWQRPCYLMADGYAATYQELVETTDWDSYGRGSDPRCDNCMAHCGYEPTAVLATSRSPPGSPARAPGPLIGS